MPTRQLLKPIIFFAFLVFCAACVKKQEPLDFFKVKTLKPEPGIQLGEVVLSGILSDAGPEGVTEHGFFWSDDKAQIDALDTLLTPRIQLGKWDNNEQFKADFLIPDANKTYYFRAFAKRELRLMVAPEVEIFSLNLLLTVDSSFTKIDNDQAFVMAQLRGLDVLRASVSGRGFVWSSKNTLPLLGVDETLEQGGRTVDGYFADTLKHLNPATTYYIRAFLRTDADTFYSTVGTFKIKDIWRNIPPAQSKPFNGREVWGAFSAVDGDKAYVGCGCTASPDPSSGGYLCPEGNVLPEIWEFNAADQSWNKLGITLPPSLKQSDAIAFVLEHKLYIGLGGYTRSNEKLLPGDFWVVDLVSHEITLLEKEFPGDRRIDAVVFTVGNNAYVGTGHGILNNTDLFYNDFYTFNPTNGWTPIDSLPVSADGTTYPDKGRWAATAFSDGDHGYVAGGITGTNGVPTTELRDCWEYDPNKHQWLPSTPLPEPRQDALAFVIHKKAYLGLGWSTLFNRGFLNDWKVLDLTQPKSWEPANRFRGNGRADAFGFALQNQGYVGSGRGSDIKGTGYNLIIWGDNWRYFPD